ncbi:MAG TPA: DUF3995 domain-containing protein [Nocardioides sp.]|uniref:DUF3995 domain-containing protein n=1 Tax=Nocardioides sp. TaxID=35761 RepID=UPI002E367D7D|nr:DUF3995 domain-containing protein [Nocardioides sp.]HEX5087968.1 DUF3995 domain-containing protein [Nocardioides sp.]
MTISTTMTAREAPAPDGGADEDPRGTTRAAYTALGWVVLFFAFHVYWYLGGSFASPGDLPPLNERPNRLETHAGVHSLVAWTVNLVVDGAWPLGALVCLALARGWARGRLARPTQALVGLGCVVLLLRGGAGILDDVTRATGLLPNGVTGLSLEDTTGHAHLRWADWAIDGYFLAGGIIFLLLAVRLRAQRVHSRPRRVGGHASHGLPDDTAPPLAPPPQRPAPRWAERLAHAIPLLVLPSSLWRLAVAFGFPMGMLNDAGELDAVRGWPAVYVAAITLVSEAVALTAFGLVRPLGEEVPRWLPIFGGRAVRPRSVIVAATVGSVALMLIWTAGFWEVWTTGRPGAMASPAWAAVFTICYAPLNLWGPALLTLTWAYRRRTSWSERRAARWVPAP